MAKSSPLSRREINILAACNKEEPAENWSRICFTCSAAGRGKSRPPHNNKSSLAPPRASRISINVDLCWPRGLIAPCCYIFILHMQQRGLKVLLRCELTPRAFYWPRDDLIAFIWLRVIIIITSLFSLIPARDKAHTQTHARALHNAQSNRPRGSWRSQLAREPPECLCTRIST